MPDYDPLIARAVSSLVNNTNEERQALYERARAVLIVHLRQADPPLLEADITHERRALEAAIRRVDAEWSAPRLSSSIEKRVYADELPGIIRAPPTKPNRKLPSNLRAVAANAITTFGVFMLGVACLSALALAPVVYILGLAWVSEHIREYIALPLSVALLLCAFIFIPLALFRTTRVVSIYGFLISSYLFGFATWILGFVITLQYWGKIGVVIGLLLGAVGIVPLGIIASAWNADWPAAVALIVTLFITYGSHMLGFRLAASLDR